MFRSRRYTPAVLFLIFSSIAYADSMPTPAAPIVGAKSYLIIDGKTGHEIAALDADAPLAPASLTKIMTTLATHGIVTTRRGAGGGAMLARPASDIRLGDVVEVLEQGQSLVECFGKDGGNCIITAGCRLKARLRAAEDSFLASLNRSTLADCALPPIAAA